MLSDVTGSRPGAAEIRPAWQDAAEEVADGVYLSQGLSNSYLVVTPEGRVVINTGMGFEAGHHRRLYDAVDTGPVRAVLLTQGHVDHVGGVDHFRGTDADPPTLVVAQANNPACQADDARIHRFRVKRSMPYWANAIRQADEFIRRQPADAPVPAQSTPTPDVLFDERHEFTLGGTTFACISTPGGETLDSMVIWLPDRGIAFVGNVFSALFGHFPNLVTLRADRLRFALPFVDAVQTVIDLEPEILCTGHFAPIRGRDTIRAELERVRDAVQFVHDETVAGMNAGVDLTTFASRRCRMTEPDEIDALARSLEALSRLDVLVNNAGSNLPGGRNEWDPEVFAEVVTLNLTGAFRLTTRCRPLLQRSELDGGAAVVNLGSMTSFFGLEFVPAYGATKAAIVQLTKTLAVSWAIDGSASTRSRPE